MRGDCFFMGARPAESMPADTAVFGMSCDGFSDGFGGVPRLRPENFGTVGSCGHASGVCLRRVLPDVKEGLGLGCG